MTLTKLSLAATLAATTLAAPVFADGHAVAGMGYGLSGDGTTLVVFSDLTAPDAGTPVTLSAPLDAIAYRPVTGELLGLSAGMIGVIDVETGEITDTGATFDEGAATGDGAAVGFDFNNKIDAVRAVSSEGVNLVYFPSDFGDEKANTVKRFTDLAYAAGDANEGATPAIFANAYTNAVNGAKQEGTAQFALDAATDSLVTLANNEGTLGTVGAITIDGEPADVSMMGGFEIISAEAGDDKALAMLMLEGAETTGLYAIDLTSGAATLIGDTGIGAMRGFAAQLPM
ncbi:DUF4394 domain-containing protein [Jannaschia marina]|uniref:DUF4394 domain-containing protein n=1 Tax=Jannaschia marina TaxID=2741674 RepID=UPI0015C9CC91|nr:DUF4394 domain-containing protein [Jannaschia marina]